MEGIHVLRDLLRAGDWMAKVDLKDAHFMLPIREEESFTHIMYGTPRVSSAPVPKYVADVPASLLSTSKSELLLQQNLNARKNFTTAWSMDNRLMKVAWFGSTARLYQKGTLRNFIVH